MTLENYKTLWGLQLSDITQDAHKHRRNIVLLYLLDITMLTVVTIILCQNHLAFAWYIVLFVGMTVLCNMVVTNISIVSKYEALRFYNRFKTKTLIEKSYAINKEQFYNILYCMGCKNLRMHTDIVDFCTDIYNMCCKDMYNAYKVMTYLSNYEVLDEESTVTVKLYYVQKGKKQYLINITSVLDIQENKGE